MKKRGALMHVHCSQPFIKNRSIAIDETWQIWSTYDPAPICICSVKTAKEWIKGARAGQKYVNKGFLLLMTSSSDHRATTTNRMHSNYLEAFKNNV